MGVRECLYGSICHFLIRSVLCSLCQHRGLLGKWLQSGVTSGRPWQETAGWEEGRGKGTSFPLSGSSGTTSTAAVSSMAPAVTSFISCWMALALGSGGTWSAVPPVLGLAWLSLAKAASLSPACLSSQPPTLYLCHPGAYWAWTMGLFFLTRSWLILPAPPGGWGRGVLGQPQCLLAFQLSLCPFGPRPLRLW